MQELWLCSLGPLFEEGAFCRVFWLFGIHRTNRAENKILSLVTGLRRHVGDGDTVQCSRWSLRSPVVALASAQFVGKRRDTRLLVRRGSTVL